MLYRVAYGTVCNPIFSFFSFCVFQCFILAYILT